MKKVKSKFSGEDLEKIKHAFDIAQEAHKGQKRRNGDDYLSHPLAVAEILLKMNADAHTICGGILHDTVEDTQLGLTEIKQKFSKDIYNLVRVLTNFQVFSDRDMNKANYYAKLKEAGKKDTRVLLIKLADRLHNSRTMQGMPLEKKKRVFQENKEFFTPLAQSLGFLKIAKELEKISKYSK
jgi:GTP pyrophosphokinase